MTFGLVRRLCAFKMFVFIRYKTMISCSKIKNPGVFKASGLMELVGGLEPPTC